MRGYDPAKAIGTVKERCLSSKKDQYGLRQCIMNRGHEKECLFAVWSDPKVVKKENELVEKKIKAEMRRR